MGAIVKSLVFLADGAPVVALVSGSNRLSEAKLARVAGASSTARATAVEVGDATGYPVGGVPPFGHDKVLPTFVDEDLLAYDEVWAPPPSRLCRSVEREAADTVGADQARPNGVSEANE